VFCSGRERHLENVTFDGKKVSSVPAGSAITNYAIVSTGPTGGIVDAYRCLFFNLFSDTAVITGGFWYECASFDNGYDAARRTRTGWR
jgi:hypothetical protein